MRRYRSRKHPVGTATRKKEPQKGEESSRGLCDNSKCTNFLLADVPEGEEGEQRMQTLFEDVMTDNVPNPAKDMNVQAREVQSVPNKTSPKRPAPRHFLI